MSIALDVLGCVALIYAVLGFVIAVIRATAHDMPWQLFVFTWMCWPSLWWD